MEGARGALHRSMTSVLPWNVGPYKNPGVVIGLVGLGSAIVLGAAASFGPLLGLLALATVPAVLLVLARPDIGALVLVAAVPVTSGFQRGLPVPGLRVSEILIGGLASLILVTAGRDKVRPWRAFDWLALAYGCINFGLGLTQLFGRGEPLTSDSLGTLIGPFQYFLLYRAVLVALPSTEQQRAVIRLLLVASIPVSLSAIFQNFHLFGVRGLIPHLTGVDLDRDFDDAYGTNAQGSGDRATGTFPHWQVLGGYEFMIILLGSATMLSKQPVLRRPWLLVVMGLAVCAAFATVTLTIIMTAVVGAALLAIWYGRIAWVVPAAVICGALALAAFGPSLSSRIDQQFGNAVDRPAWVPDTMDYRYRLWRDQYLPIISDGRWVSGYGPDPPPNLSFPFTESLYITLLLRGGLPLLLAYAALSLALLAAALRARNSDNPAQEAAARVIVVATLLLIPMHTVEPYFVMTGFAPLFWLTAAVAISGAPAHATATAPAPARRVLAAA